MPDNLTLEEKTDIARNNLKIEKALGVTKGKPMTYEQANKGKENPKFGKEEGYRVNCQTCTVTHMLRRLGFDIEQNPTSDKAHTMKWQNKVSHGKNVS